MKPRDVFKIVVAIFGLLGFCYGALYLIDGVLAWIGLFQMQYMQPKYWVARGLIEMILGVSFMKGFPPFVDWVFPPGSNLPDKMGARKSGDETP